MAEASWGSVVIPAHDEAAVIGRCLDALLDGLPAGALEIVVVCNGCSDRTADVARARGARVTVVETPEASKAGALRLGDDVALAFPRLYLDADVVLPGASAVAVLSRLAEGAVLAARPALRYETDRCSAWVRRYYSARTEIPGLMRRLWGAGVYGLSAAGHARVGTWPDGVADDLYVDSLFTDEEIEILDVAPVVVSVPRSARALLAVLRRGARAKASHAAAHAAPDAALDGAGTALPLRQSLRSTVLGLGRLALREPRVGVDVAVYAGFALAGRLRGRRRFGTVWERDTSTRL